MPDGLAERPGVHGLQVEGGRVRMEVDTARLGETLGVLAAAGLRSLVSQPPTLEELFLRHYGQQPADVPAPTASVAGPAANR